MPPRPDEGFGVGETLRSFAVVLVTRVGTASGSRAAAAALACAGSEPDRAALLIELDDGRRPRPSLLATAAARRLEERLAVHLPDAGVASRGSISMLKLPPDPGGIERIAAALPLVREAVAVVHLPPGLMQPTLAEPRVRPTGALLRAELPSDRALAALAARDLLERGLRVAVLKRPLEWVAARRALLGALPAESGALPGGLRARLLDPGERDEIDLDFCQGCGLRVAECPCGAIEMVPERI
jgi:ferredoxin